MSEDIIIAMLTTFGAIVGPIIVSLIQANATIKAAQIETEKNLYHTTTFLNRNRLLVTIITAILGGILVFLLSSSLLHSGSGDSLSCDKYGVQIVSPTSGEVAESFRVSGTYQEIPGESTIWVITGYRGADVVNYRPEARAIVNKRDRTWYTDVNYPKDVDESIEIVAFLVGKDGEILIQYHFKVGDVTKQWPALTDLPSDIVECDSVNVMIR